MPPLPFYAQVKIAETAPDEVAGLTGIVMGRAERHGRWGYSVHVDGLDESYDLRHEDLTPTGIMFKRSDFYSGESITVIVDENGNGKIKGQP